MGVLKVLAYGSFIVLCILILLYIVFAIVYNDDARGEVKISFDKFYTLYKMNPKLWDIDWDGHVRYNSKYEDFPIAIYFNSYFDALRFKHFRNNKNKIQIDMAMDAKMTKLVEYWQEDVNSYRKKHYDEIKKLKEDLDRYERKTKEKIEEMGLYDRKATKKEQMVM